MQRINLFPNPRFSPDGASTGAWGIDYANDMPGDGTLRPSNSQGYDELHIPKLAPGVEYVLRVRSDNRLGKVLLFIDDAYSSSSSQDGSGLIVIRLTAPATGSQKDNRAVFYNPGVYSQPQLELASTYDAAVGGASGLLHGGYDASRLTPAVGVVSDDGDEYRQQSERHNRSESKRVDEYNQRPEQDQHGILRQRLSARQWRLHQGVLQWARNNQLRSTCQLPDDKLKRKPDERAVQRRVRQSDRHRDEYAHLHVGGIQGEQGPARQHRIFHREYDAARLTLLGVMA